MNRRALVIGGNRFLGAALGARLRASGAHLTLVNRRGTGEGDVVVASDRNDIPRLRAELGGATWDVVFDLAAFQPRDAESAIAFFRDRVGHFVAVSSIAVYMLGEGLSETDFRAADHPAPAPTRPLPYAAGKRAVEALLGGAPFPVTLARLPFLLGHQDPSGRLAVHFARARAHEPTYFMNPEARVQFLSIDDASAFLHAVGARRTVGAINYGAPPLRYRDFLALVARTVGAPARLAPKQSPTNGSPYELGATKTMAVERARALGLAARSIEDCLGPLASLA